MGPVRKVKAVHHGYHTSGSDLDHRAVASCSSATLADSIEISVGPLDQRSNWCGAFSKAKRMQRGKRARGRDFVDRARSGSTRLGDPVVVTVGPLNGRRIRIASVAVGKIMEYRQDSGGSDLEDDSVVGGATLPRRAVEIAVAPQRQAAPRSFSMGGAVEVVNYEIRASGRDLENTAKTQSSA